MGKLTFLIIISVLTPIFFTTQLVKSAETTEEWENQGIEWYYDHLDDDDRRKIRQAMDYAIPRQQIIEEFYGGLASPLATEIGKNMVGYNDSIQPREYDITKAKALMTEVFNKTYSPTVEVNDTVTNIPYFSITIVSPTTSVYRTVYEDRIVESFQSIGIDVELKWWNFNILMPRIYYDPKGVGYNYDHEGVDAWFVGMNMFIDPDLSSRYFISEFPPEGDNAFWIENDKVTTIINRSLTNPDLRERLVALSDFQHWFYDEVPKSIIQQPIDVFAVDEELEGFDTYLIGRGWCFNNWTIGDQTSMTYTLPGDFFDFNPLMHSRKYEPWRYYELVPMTNVFGSLSQRRGAYNLSHPVPQIAENWSSNAEGTIWEVLIRDGIKWSDGSSLTVDDVLFTYQSVFEDELDSPNQGFFLDRFPNNASDIYLKNGTTNTIIFNLGSFYPYVTSQVFSLNILKKTQWDNIPYNDWKTHHLNKGTENEFPIGCGPYMMTDFDLTTGVKLEINPYFDQEVFGHDPDAIGGGIFYTNPTIDTINVIVVREAKTAIAGLYVGDFDVLDSKTVVQAQFDEINDHESSKCITALVYGWQELNYNHYDPRWGMNAHDPRELYRDYDKLKNPISELLFIIPIILYLLSILTLFGILLFLTINGIAFLRRRISEIP